MMKSLVEMGSDSGKPWQQAAMAESGSRLPQSKVLCTAGPAELALLVLDCFSLLPLFDCIACFAIFPPNDVRRSPHS